MEYDNLQNFQPEESDIKLSHLDFSVNDDFDYKTETLEINNFLLSKKWDFSFAEQNNVSSVNDIKLINTIFSEVYEKFHKRIDSVEMFHIITSFYSLNEKDCFSKLIVKYRKILFADLTNRIGEIRNIKRINKDEENTELVFKSIFN